MAQLGALAPCVEVLHLSECTMPKGSLLEALQHLPRLRSIEIIRVKSVAQDEMMKVCEAASGLRPLHISVRIGQYEEVL